MTTQVDKLNKKIMRSIYYAFGIKVIMHPFAIHGAALFIVGLLLAKAVHVAAIYHNFLGVQIGDIGSWLVSTFVGADISTLVLIGIAIFTVLSLRIRLSIPTWHNSQTI